MYTCILYIIIKAHGATDVTGFGLIGHAQNLVESQQNQLDFIINRLPCIRHMITSDESLNNMFKLKEGKSAETSGGLLISLSPETVESFISELKKLNGHDVWIVGNVIEGTRQALLADKLEITEIMADSEGHLVNCSV